MRRNNPGSCRFKLDSQISIRVILVGGPGLTVVELSPQDGFRYASGKRSTAAPGEPSTMLTCHTQRAFVFYNNWHFLQSGVIPAQGYKSGYSSISEPVGGQAIYWTPMISYITAGVALQVNDMWKADCCSFAFVGLSILAAVIQPVIQGCYGGEEKTQAFFGKIVTCRTIQTICLTNTRGVR